MGRGQSFKGQLFNIYDVSIFQSMSTSLVKFSVSYGLANSKIVIEWNGLNLFANKTSDHFSPPSPPTLSTNEIVSCPPPC
jgi:hypothetical protein